MDTRPLNPKHWPLTEARPVPSVIRRLISIKKELKRSNYSPNDRIALMVNAADVEELITALTRARGNDMTSHAVIINNGAGSDETPLKTFDTKAAATAFVLEVYGQSAPAQTLVVVGWDETHGEVHGLFLCGEDCTEHTDGHPFVFVLPVA